MSTQKPVCQVATVWIKQVKGKGVLAPFTGQDYAAFKTFIHAVELYAYSDNAGRKEALLCMRHAVLAMQPKVRWIARETIPQQLDWSDREKLWTLIVGDSLVKMDGAA
jgi:hypothetical protein